MFSHVIVGTNDLDRAKSFYDPLMATLGVPPARHKPLRPAPHGVTRRG
jgi:catechol 2,3-dioxygenase-like lactoylglutathione lyase family enzyme